MISIGYVYYEELWFGVRSIIFQFCFPLVFKIVAYTEGPVYITLRYHDIADTNPCLLKI